MKTKFYFEAFMFSIAKLMLFFFIFLFLATQLFSANLLAFPISSNKLISSSKFLMKVNDEILVIPNFGEIRSQFAGGTGTSNDPYLIETANQLDMIRFYLGASFRLINNIDLNQPPWNQGEGWVPIGTISVPFTGSFDGDMFEISNLYINRPDNWYVGVFGFLTGAVVKNVFVSNTHVTGAVMVGSIGGKGNYGTLFENIHVNNATIFVTDRYSGGLIGGMDDCTVRRCSSSGSNTYVGSDWNFIGGLIGGVTSSTTNQGNLIEESFSKSKLFSSSHNSYGGLLGVTWVKTEIRNCYSRGSIIGNGDFVGGFLGEVGEGYSLNVSNNYSTTKVLSNASNVHGFIGFLREGNFDGNFWDYESSGQNYDPVATGKSSSQMKMEETFQNEGWNFNDIWTIDTFGIINQGYPFLKYELELYNNCTVPVSTSILSLTDSLCHIQWIVPNVGSFNCQLLWGLSGFNPSTEGFLVDSIPTQDYVLDSLLPNISYDVYIRSQCDTNEYSQWSNKFTFKTFELFRVSGGGSYCANVIPNQIFVSLSGSQTEMNYALLKDDVSYGDTLAGTNYPIQWSNLVSGTYKVKVFSDEASIYMIDSAIVIESQVPLVSFTIPDDTLCLSWNSYELSGGQPEGGIYTGFNVNSGVFYPPLAGLGVHNIYYTYTNELGCSVVVLDQVFVADCVSLGTISMDSFINVYPNPTLQKLRLSFSKQVTSVAKLSIYNDQGQIVFSKIYHEINMSDEIDVSNFLKGTYSIIIENNDSNLFRSKFVKL